MPSNEQALAEWLWTKHLELMDALEIGDPSVVAVEPTLGQIRTTKAMGGSPGVAHARMHGARTVGTQRDVSSDDEPQNG